jgi:peptide chain release factor 1
MWEQLESVKKRYEELSRLMAQPELVADVERLRSLAQERVAIEETVSKYGEYKKTIEALEETRGMLGGELDPEMILLAKHEIEGLEARCDELAAELRLALLPQDPNDKRDVIMEIRAAAGGEEAGLFAADLYRMYYRYAQKKGWEVDVIDSSESGVGGFKEIVFEVGGKAVYGRLKYERGVHRVQRVPVTEASGRIHTSTATVAVLPQADEVEVNIRPDDLRMDFFHSSGAGGQNVNKVATAVRITHLPSGMVATCQDERSQIKNRMKAMAVLRARLLDGEQRRQQEGIVEERRSQVGSGDRAEKIRTYNFPQNRITDHRIGLTLYNLSAMLEGELDGLIDSLAASEKVKQMEKSFR